MTVTLIGSRESRTFSLSKGYWFTAGQPLPEKGGGGGGGGRRRSECSVYCVLWFVVVERRVYSGRVQIVYSTGHPRSPFA
jgi:hypothetical protein